MKTKSIQLQIPRPCAENWEAMRIVDDQHRHCAACDRVLVDFSKMTDDELLIYFYQQKGKTCGQFSVQQLNRSLQLIPDPKRSARWWKAAVFAPLAFFAGKASAQTAAEKGTTKFPHSALSDKGDAPAKDTLPHPATGAYILSGKISDETNGEAFLGANVVLFEVAKDGTTGPALAGASSDMDGNYKITLPVGKEQAALRLEVTLIGYEKQSQDFPTGLQQPVTVCNINLPESVIVLKGEVIAVAPPRKDRQHTFWKKVRGTFALK